MLGNAKRGSLVDWTTLPEELLDVILGKLFHISDYFRFGSVCQYWRSVALNSKRISTMPPLLLVGGSRVDAINYYKSEPAKLYNPEERKLYNHQLQVPQFPPFCSKDDYLGSSNGWLVIIRGKHRLVQLFNPFSQRSIEIPFAYGFLQKVILSCNPALHPDDYIVGAICWTHDLGYCIAFKKSGHKCWRFAQRLPRYETHPWIVDILFHKESLYVLGEHSRLMAIDCKSSNDGDYDQVAPVIKLVRGSINRGITGKLYLVEGCNDSDLLLVERILHPLMDEPVVEKFKIYKLTKSCEQEKEEFDWVEISKLENCVGSIFLVDGDNEYYCMSAICVPNINKNSTDIIYIRCLQSFSGDVKYCGLFRMIDGTYCEAGEFYDQKFDLPIAWITPTLVRRKTCKDVIDDGSESEEKKLLDKKDNNREFSKPGKSMAKTALEKLEDDRKNLLVYPYRESLLRAVHDNQILIITGETGSGKSTQIPQYLHEAGYTKCGKVGCTQPRGDAVATIASRVAREMGVKLGHEVGYSIRFGDCSSEATILKYIYDRMLILELLSEPDLASYSVVMLDEAQERSLSTDILFSLVKDIARSRPDLKVLISSATEDAAKFSAYFHSAPIFRIPGQQYPIDIIYAREPHANYFLAAVDEIIRIHEKHGDGDILVFLPDQKHIEMVVKILKNRARNFVAGIPELIICSMYDQLLELQGNLFVPTPEGARKVVLAVDIAKTSLAIDGIRYVIDPGYFKSRFYDPRTGMTSTRLTPISKASASQRACRSGQTGPGICHRLYTRYSYDHHIQENDDLEIQRDDLVYTVFILKRLGVQDLSGFDFMDPPSNENLSRALKLLYAIGALDDHGGLTEVGMKMAHFPLDTRLSRMIVASDKYKCSSEIISIVAMLLFGNAVYYCPEDKQLDLEIARERFRTGNAGDHIELLNVYNSWKEANFSTQWCDENYIRARIMKQARSIRDQLESLLKLAEIKVTSNPNDLEAIKKAILSGSISCLARLQKSPLYHTFKYHTRVQIHSSSGLAKVLPTWIVYHTCSTKGSEKYMVHVTEIKPEWLEEVAPHYYSISMLKNEDQIRCLE